MSTGTKFSATLRKQLRIVWTIATKDIFDALRNRTILFNILTAVFIMLMYQQLGPLMFASDPDVVVYDTGGSRLVAAVGSMKDWSAAQVQTPSFVRCV